MQQNPFIDDKNVNSRERIRCHYVSMQVFYKLSYWGQLILDTTNHFMHLLHHPSTCPSLPVCCIVNLSTSSGGKSRSPKQITHVWTRWHTRHLLFLSARLFRESEYPKENKSPSLRPVLHKYPKGSLSRKCQHPGTRNTRVMLSTNEVSLPLVHTLTRVYSGQVKQHPCPPISRILALMRSSSCGRLWARSALMWPTRRRWLLDPLLPSEKILPPRGAEECQKCSLLASFPFSFICASLPFSWGLFSQWEGGIVVCYVKIGGGWFKVPGFDI